MHQGHKFVAIVWEDNGKTGTIYLTGQWISRSQNTISIKDGRCVKIYDAKGHKKSSFYCWDE